MEITLEKVKEWLESFPEEPYSMTRLYVTWLLGELERAEDRLAVCHCCQMPHCECDEY